MAYPPRSPRVAFLVSLLLAGCGGEAGTDGGDSASGTGGSGSLAGAAVSADLPCEVGDLINTYCVACHDGTPPGSLLTAEDFLAASRTNPSDTMAEEIVRRLQSSGSDHMPPSSLAQPGGGEIQAFSDWVAAGQPAGSCDSPTTATIPEPTCTSGQTWTGGNWESPLMHPGGTCIDCHSSSREGPLFSFAGTLYPTPYELDDCNGVGPTDAAGATVVVVDANGQELALAPNAAGNFYSELRSLTLPYTARVEFEGRTLTMSTPQDSGDCNGCHTETGTNGAPGRIFLP